MKMKVSVLKLKTAIAKHQRDDESRFERELKAFEEQQLKDRSQYIDNVERYLKELRAGKEPVDSYSIREFLKRGCKDKTAPSKAAHYGDLLKRLDLCVTDTVVVDDKSEYMRFLSGKCVC